MTASFEMVQLFTQTEFPDVSRMCRLVPTWAPRDYLNRAHLHGRLRLFDHQNTTKNNKQSNINTPFYKTQALSSIQTT